MKESDKVIQRLKEESLYSSVMEEIESGFYARGLWGKALADSNGNEKYALSLYLKYRVKSLIDEERFAPSQRDSEEAVRLQSAVDDLRSSGFGVNKVGKLSWKVTRPDGKLARYFYSVKDILSFHQFVKDGGSM